MTSWPKYGRSSLSACGAGMFNPYFMMISCVKVGGAFNGLSLGPLPAPSAEPCLQAKRRKIAEPIFGGPLITLREGQERHHGACVAAFVPPVLLPLCRGRLRGGCERSAKQHHEASVRFPCLSPRCHASRGLLRLPRSAPSCSHHSPLTRSAGRETVHLLPRFTHHYCGICHSIVSTGGTKGGMWVGGTW